MIKETGKVDIIAGYLYQKENHYYNGSGSYYTMHGLFIMYHDVTFTLKKCILVIYKNRKHYSCSPTLRKWNCYGIRIYVYEEL